MPNVTVDRRHDRRPLSEEEFGRLVEAAMVGPEVLCIPGPDRAMMYILSAWTGYRRSELASLTKQSLRLDDSPPTVTVAACYSKRKRQDTQVLHPEVASRLREWLKTKKRLPADAVLFPVSAKAPGGVDRRTAKMMRVDLKAARKKWIEEAKKPEEKVEREQSEFLKYQDSRGLFADFHSNRHTFITNLERVGVSPRRAQSLARHSDIRLTMGVYTHINLHDQSAAIELLPAPPEIKKSRKGSANGKANGSSPAVPDLGTAWAKLPEQVKAEIVAMVNAAGKEGSVAT
jgi:integrase